MVTSATSHWPCSMAMAANEIIEMFVAPPWSQTPPIRGWMPSASATIWPYIERCWDVGYLTNRPSTMPFSTPASASALRHASTFMDVVERSGSLPWAV